MRPSLFASALVIVALVITGCGDDDSDNSGSENASGEESGEHDGESGEHDGESGGEDGGDSGEESGTEYAKDERYDETRNGARLVLAYGAGEDAFIGTVENTTDSTLEQVRVEVHLIDGVELGPTTPEDLGPGAVADIVLDAAGADFETWSAHPEVGRGEHGDKQNGDGA